MKCAAGYKCKCTQFRAVKKTRLCGRCSHDIDSHYSSGDEDESESNHSPSDASGSSDDNIDTTPLPTNAKSKMTVASLADDLINGGDYSKASVGTARREANAGLTRQKVGSTFTELHLGEWS